MEYCSSFSDRMQKKSSFIILLLVFFVSALHHVYSSISALYRAYCSVLSSSPHIFSWFILLLIFFLCILFLDILLFITLYYYPPFIMLQYSIIVIQATSGIIRVWDAVIDLLHLQLNCIISSCRLLLGRRSILDDYISCRSDNSGFILWVYILS